MFRFFKKKTQPSPAPAEQPEHAPAPAAPQDEDATLPASEQHHTEPANTAEFLPSTGAESGTAATGQPHTPPDAARPGIGWFRNPFARHDENIALTTPQSQHHNATEPVEPQEETPPSATVSQSPQSAPQQAAAAPAEDRPLQPHPAPTTATAPAAEPDAPPAQPATEETLATEARQRQGWLDRLKSGLRKTGGNIASVFVATKIDDALYEELEDALLMADTGVKATQHLLDDLKERVRRNRITEPPAVKAQLAEALTALLLPLEKPLLIGEHNPTVIMVAGVNGAGKTTSIGKLTSHLAQHQATVILAAADTFRAAAREQLGIWADRNMVEIVSQEGGDPAAVSFDAVSAGRARKKDVVLIDTAGRLPTQLHLMEELKKIRRVITKAEATAPHEVLLVIDGNTGQNALTQVKAFDDALQLTGLIVTKLDGTAKGGVLAAIAQERPIPVYFIGVGEKLEDLQTFSAREFAEALLG